MRALNNAMPLAYDKYARRGTALGPRADLRRRHLHARDAPQRQRPPPCHHGTRRHRAAARRRPAAGRPSTPLKPRPAPRTTSEVSPESSHAPIFSSSSSAASTWNRCRCTSRSWSAPSSSSRSAASRCSAAITYFRLWGYLWREWFTTVDHKKIGIMYMILGIVMLLRGFADALMMRAAAGDRVRRLRGLSARRITTTRSSPPTA